jgi:hypothetical protein
MISNKVKFSGYVRLPKPQALSTLKDIEVSIPNYGRPQPKVASASVDTELPLAHTPVDFGGSSPLS